MGVLDEVLIDDDRLNTIFGKYDINDNRVLTRDEFAAVVFDLNQIHAPDDALDAVIPLGGVTREKLSDILKRYKTYMNTRNKKIKAHRILVANFSAFDKNGSGALEEAEIMTWLRSKKGNEKRAAEDLDNDLEEILVKLKLDVDDERVIPLTRAEEAEHAFEVWDEKRK